MLSSIFFTQRSLVIDPHVLAVLVVAVYVIFLFFADGVYQREVWATSLLDAAPYLVLPIVISYLFPGRLRGLSFFRLPALFVVAGVMRFLMLFSSPHPFIDLFTLFLEAPILLLSGINPYAASMSEVYKGIPTIFHYWPTPLLLQVPFVSNFHDPRVLYVIADMAVAFFLYCKGNKTAIAELLTILYLFRPHSLFITEQSWLSALEFIFICLAVGTASFNNVRQAASALNLFTLYFSFFHCLYFGSRRGQLWSPAV
jgi:hypothetical protein